MKQTDWKILYTSYEGLEKKAVDFLSREVGKYLIRESDVYRLYVLACDKQGAKIEKNAIVVGLYDESETVRKYVESLEHRGLIHTEPTKVKTRDGRTHNGSLLYTILPIQPIVDDYYQEQLSLAEYYSAYTKAMKEHEKKYGGVNNEKVNV